MPRTLLLEAGFVSLPLNAFGHSLPDLKTVVRRVVEQENFDFSRVQVWVNSNRVGILVEGLADAQANTVKEIRGPKESAAYDLNNLPTPAATGFASAQGLELKDLIVREVDGEKFLFAKKLYQGQNLEECLARICEKIFNSFPFFTLSWAEKSCFPQPVINFCAMLDDQVLEIKFENIKACDQVLYFDGIRRKGFKIDHASSYPQVMKQLGVFSEIKEKKKALDAKIRSILPEGYLLRDTGNRVSLICTFYENVQPILINFNKKFLEMPAVILEKIIAGYFSYFLCEDAYGKVLPGALALPPAATGSDDEADIRKAFLDQELEKVWKIWNQDIHVLPGKLEAIAEQLSDEGFVKSDLFGNCSLSGVAEGLCDYVSMSELKKSVSPVITLIEEGERTEIGRLLEGTGISVIFNRLEGVESFRPYAECLKEVCQYFEERIPAPSLPDAKIVSLAVLLQGYINNIRCFDCTPDRILSFLNCTGLKIDLFSVLTKLFPNKKVDKKMWFEKAFRLQNREGIFPYYFDNFSGRTEFDPASFFQAYSEWKDVTNEQLETFNGTVKRLRAKLGDIDQKVYAEPDKGLESELSKKLEEIEALPGVDYPAIFNFFLQEKVDIEACLINLPAVLDDTSKEHVSRISLLQRLYKQLAKLPLVKREKKGEKKS